MYVRNELRIEVHGNIVKTLEIDARGSNEHELGWSWKMSMRKIYDNELGRYDWWQADDTPPMDLYNVWTAYRPLSAFFKQKY